MFFCINVQKKTLFAVLRESFFCFLILFSENFGLFEKFSIVSCFFIKGNRVGA